MEKNLKAERFRDKVRDMVKKGLPKFRKKWAQPDAKESELAKVEGGGSGIPEILPTKKTKALFFQVPLF